MTNEHHQQFEADFWGTCQNTYGEETKQFTYAKHLGLTPSKDEWGSPYSFDMAGKSILDIGGGPTSLLLKCRNYEKATVVDPCKYPDWVKLRYLEANIGYLRMDGEEVNLDGYDEVWIYNVLQHVIDPEQIIKNALRAGKVLRIFEWIDIPPHDGHPHMLTREKLDAWIGKPGTVGELTGENECYGKFYANVR